METRGTKLENQGKQRGTRKLRGTRGNLETKENQRN